MSALNRRHFFKNLIGAVTGLFVAGTSAAQGSVKKPLRKYAMTTIGGYGRTTTCYDPFGHVTTMVYDSGARLQSIVEPIGIRTSTVFDAHGRVTARIDALGNRTDFANNASVRHIVAMDTVEHPSFLVCDS